MPRFYFDIDDGEVSTVDDQGTDHADAEAARLEGIDTLPHVVKDAMPDGNMRDFKLDERNETGRVIFKAIISLRSHWVE